MPEGVNNRPNVQTEIPPHQPGEGGSPGNQRPDDAARGSQHAADQAQQDAQKAQMEAQQKAQAEAAQKAAIQNLMDGPSLTLPQDFMGVLDHIVKEGYETAKSSHSGKTGDQDAEGGMGQKDTQKDIATLREFMREAKYLVENQGMSVAQMFNMIKVEQGGAFWQKLQQVLQKGLPMDQATALLKKGDPTESARMEAAFKTLSVGGTAESMKTPGKAILELLKAEINPQSQVDNFLAALKMLNKDGMNQSAERLRSYLRRRGGVPEEALQYFFTDQKKEIFQGPFPKEIIQPVNWWYILLALGAFGTSMGLGLNIWEATLMGIGVAALMFFLSFIYKR